MSRKRNTTSQPTGSPPRTSIREASAKRDVARLLFSGAYPLYAEDVAHCHLAEEAVAKGVEDRFEHLCDLRECGATLETIQALLSGQDAFASDRMLAEWWTSGAPMSVFRGRTLQKDLRDEPFQYREGSISAAPRFDAHVRSHLFRSIEALAADGSMRSDVAERLSGDAKAVARNAAKRQYAREMIARKQAEIRALAEEIVE